MTLDACFCGRPATRTLAAVGSCDGCLETILAPIRRRVAERHGCGFGEQHGPLRPDWGSRYADLQCSVCEATWVGPIGEPCSWCADALEHMRAWQAEILLAPELPDVDDERYEAAATAWAERLGRGVRAGLISETQMMAVIRREVERRVA